jgi:hypothetical protein
VNFPEINPLIEKTCKDQHGKKKLLYHYQKIDAEPDPSGDFVLVQEKHNDG